MMKRRLAVVAASIALIFAGSTQAAEWPTKPVTQDLKQTLSDSGVAISILVSVIVGPIGALNASMGVFSCGGFGLLSFAGRVTLTSLNRERRGRAMTTFFRHYRQRGPVDALQMRLQG